MKGVLIAALSGVLVGQPQPPAVFRATTDLVEIDAVVRDKSGQFVRDLQPSDFELRDEGQPQTVELLTVIAPESAAPPRPQPDGAVAVPASAGAAGRAPARMFLVMFDDAHLSRENFRRAQNAAAELFTKQFHDGDVGGVVFGGQVVNGRLTSDRTELAAAVRKLTPGPASDSRTFEFLAWPRMNEIEVFRVAAEDRSVLQGLVSRACIDDPPRCQPPSSPADAEQEIRLKASRLEADLQAQSERTLRILYGALTNLERFEARKTIVLLSEGFAADESWAEVQHAVGLAARINARIYTLDARGLAISGSSVLNQAPEDSQARALSALGGADDAINSLAQDTGGFVVRNANDFTKAIATIADDSTRYYVLGYRPARAPDGKFHRVSVRVKRPGVSVRARRGYVATPSLMPLTTAAAPLRDRADEVSRADAAGAAAPGPAPATAPDPAPIEATPIAPAAMGAVVGLEPASGVRLRPFAEAHVGDLASAHDVDADAEAGWNAYQRGDLESARASLRPAAARADAQPWVHYALGMADYALRDYDDAIAQWEQVRTSNPDFEPVYFDLVDGYDQAKDRRKAIQILHAAEGRWPADPEVLNALGAVYAAASSFDEAIAAFQRATTVAPDESTSYINLGIAYELRYWKSRKFFVPTKRWIANEADRTAAIAGYQRYLAFNGPYAAQARAGLNRLKWAEK